MIARYHWYMSGTSIKHMHLCILPTRLVDGYQTYLGRYTHDVYHPLSVKMSNKAREAVHMGYENKAAERIRVVLCCSLFEIHNNKWLG